MPDHASGLNRIENLVKTGRGWPAYLLAVLFSLFTMIGRSFKATGDLSLLIGSRAALIRGTALSVVLALVYGGLLCLLYGWMSEKAPCAKENGAAGAVRRFYLWTQSLPDGQYFLTLLCILMLCWLPYLVLYYPGSTVPDGLWQIKEGLGLKTLSGKHSWELSLLFGFLVRLGSRLNDNFGFFLVVLFLALGQALCYAFVCLKIRQWKAPAWLRVGTPLFFGFFPLFGAYSQTLIKDGISCALFALFMAACLDLCFPDIREWYFSEEKAAAAEEEEGRAAKKGSRVKGPEASLEGRKVCLVLFSGLAAAVTRRNEMYILAPMAVFLFFLLKKGRRRYGLLILAGLLAGYMGLQSLGSAIGVKEGSSRAYYSVMFQQTARYLTQFPDEVTKEERKAINGVLKLKKIIGKYNPDLSDPVKNRFREKSTAEDRQAYVKAWRGMLKKHPLVYVEAFLNGNYGYYDPFSLITVTAPYYLDDKENYTDTAGFDWHHIFPAAMRRMGKAWGWLWKMIPVVRLTIRPGTWTWFYLILAGWLCHKKRWRMILPILGLGLLWGICLLSPVNGCIRYYLPVYACGPLFLCWVSQGANVGDTPA